MTQSLIMQLEHALQGAAAQLTIAKTTALNLSTTNAVDRAAEDVRTGLEVIEKAKVNARVLWGHEIINGLGPKK